MSAVVAANLFVPCVAESRQSAAVRSYDHIVVRGHEHEVPAERPELADRTLRTTFAIQQGGIFLVGIEMRGQDNPCQHLLAVRCRLPARNNLSAFYLIVYIVVLVRQLLQRIVFFPFQAIHLVRLHHRVAQQVDAIVANIADNVVVLSFGYLHQFAL